MRHRLSIDPRASGEDFGSLLNASKKLETPPREQGRQGHGDTEHQRHGNTLDVSGEVATCLAARNSFQENLPPKRRNVDHSAERLGGHGNTPACAGKDGAGNTPARAGKRIRAQLVPHVVGNTPAWAGNATCVYRPTGPGGKHPRGRRGRHKSVFLVVVGVGKTPARVGRTEDARLFRTVAGNTPAGAGKTPGSSERSHCAGKHPRTCGEKQATKNLAAIAQETPPPKRGRLLNRRKVVNGLGNTPA